jgi:hypothetical protein
MIILILGCSWGVPNYFGEPGVPKEHHLEYLLSSAGHEVHNCAINEGSNSYTLSRAVNYIQGKLIQHPAYRDQQIPGKNIKPDWTIWFHTELFRDRHLSPTILDYNLIARKIYADYRDFFANVGGKVAVIGGAGDVLPCLSDYITPDFFIPSWRKFLLGNNTPISNNLQCGEFVNDNGISKISKLEMIEENLEIFSKLDKSNLFPDRIHPGTIPHRELFNQLKKIFDN